MRSEHRPTAVAVATLAALREIPAGRELPVVFMTSRVQAQEVAAYREMGAADVIPKPFSLKQLTDKVDDALAGRPAEIVSLARQAVGG